jgi:RimJ/RimL family protein N-acetyltransferase
MEKEDLPLVAEWANNPESGGEYEPLEQVSHSEVEKWYDSLRSEEKWFIIETRDGRKIGQIFHAPRGPHFLIGYRLLPSERNKGYGTDAVQLIVDYLFLSQHTGRIQAETNPRNIVSQRALEKAGFQREGLVRRSVFIRGKWEDGVLYSILREDWKEPRILAQATQ